jgi:hypothetical protein
MIASRSRGARLSAGSRERGVLRTRVCLRKPLARRASIDYRLRDKKSAERDVPRAGMGPWAWAYS